MASLSLLATNTVSFVLSNIDRWWAAEQLAPSEFGTYAFAWTMIMIAQSLQVVVNASAFPALARRFANGPAAGAYQLASRLSWSSLAIGVLAIIPTFAGVTWLVESIYPAYTPALVALPYFLIVAVLKVSDYWSAYLVIIGREKTLLFINTAMLLVIVSGWRIGTSQMDIQAFALLSAALALSGWVLPLIACRNYMPTKTISQL